MPRRERSLLDFSLSVVTGMTLVWMGVPFAGARSWAHPGCPAQSGGWGPLLGQGRVRHVPQELASCASCASCAG